MNRFNAVQFNHQLVYFKNSIYQLLCFKEENNPTTAGRFQSVQQELRGFGHLCGDPPIILTVLSLLEEANHEKVHRFYRKALLDAIGMLNQIEEVRHD